MGRPDLQLAALWATERHFGQWRDGRVPLPYVSHPFEVLGLLRSIGGVTDLDMLCAALLHDLVEETDTTLEDIREEFGTTVTHIVFELTRVEPSEDDVKGLTKDEIRTLRANLLLDEIANMDSSAQTIKLCDRISNLRGAQTSKRGKSLARYVKQSQAILNIVPESVNPNLWNTLQDEISQVKL